MPCQWTVAFRDMSLCTVICKREQSVHEYLKRIVVYVVLRHMLTHLDIIVFVEYKAWPRILSVRKDHFPCPTVRSTLGPRESQGLPDRGGRCQLGDTSA